MPVGSSYPKIGLLVTALLEDQWNKTGHMRPEARSATWKLAEVLKKFGEVVCPGFVETEEDALNAANLFRSERVNLVVFAELAYTKGLIPIRALLPLDVPILIWNTQFIRTLPDDADFDLIMMNSGMAGIPEIAGALVRTGKPFAVVTGHIEDSSMLSSLGEYIAASKILGFLRSAKIGVIGHPFEGMTDLMVDQLSLRQNLGVVVWPIEHEEVAIVADEISISEVAALIDEERLKYGIVDVPEPALEKSIRVALALEKIVARHSVDAVALFDQIWLPDSRIGVIPSYGTSRMVAKGVPFTCEADVPQAVAMLILQHIAGHSTFLENYVMDFERDAMVLSHDGHGNPALAESPKAVSMKLSIYYEGVNGFGASFEYAYRPGPVTLLCVAPARDGKWRFIVAEGESLPIKPRPVVAPQMLFKYSRGDVNDFASRWCLAGPSHHHAAAYGNLSGVITKLGAFLGVETIVI